MEDPVITFAARVEDFLATTGLAPSTFGAEACGDRNFVADLRDGMEPRAARRKKIEDFMAGYRLPGSASANPNGSPAADPSQVQLKNVESVARAPGAAPRDEGRAA